MVGRDNPSSVVIPADVESWVSKAEGLSLAELAADKMALELGAWLGHSTICMGQTARQLVSVDWHQGDPHAGEMSTLDAYYRNLSRYGLAERVITIVGRFEQVLPLLPDRRFDLVFLDGFHTYAQVKADIKRLQPKLAENGIVCFHDYGNPDYPGLTQAVQETFGTPTRLIDTLAIFER